MQLYFRFITIFFVFSHQPPLCPCEAAVTPPSPRTWMSFHWTVRTTADPSQPWVNTHHLLKSDRSVWESVILENQGQICIVLLEDAMQDYFYFCSAGGLMHLTCPCLQEFQCQSQHSWSSLILLAPQPFNIVFNSKAFTLSIYLSFIPFLWGHLLTSSFCSHIYSSICFSNSTLFYLKEMNNSKYLCDIYYVTNDFISNKCIKESWKYALMIIIINVSWAENQHIRVISEGSCDTEDWNNDALPSQE